MTFWTLQLLRQSFSILNPMSFFIDFLTLSQTLLYSCRLSHLQPKLKPALSYCYQIHSFFLNNILNTSTQVSDHLHAIILIVSSTLFYQIAIDSKVFRTAPSFEKSYPVLLDFSESELYLINSLCNIHLGFAEGYNLY